MQAAPAVMDRHEVVALPKAELHVHLELSMQSGTAAALAGRPGPVASGPWADQATFVRECEVVRDLVTDLDVLRRVAEELMDSAAAQGIWWTEVTCAPQNYGGRLGPVRDVVEAIREGLARGCRRTGVSAGIILAHNRAHDEVRGLELLDLCVEDLPRATADTEDPGRVAVVALGLVGDEAAFPPALHRDLFEQARTRGVRRVVHAGEGDGPVAIRQAWTELHADRLAHGVLAAQSPELLAELAAAQVCLDVCPTSNVQLGASRSLREHQLPALLGAGVPVSLGSDATLLFGTDLVGEYGTAVRELGLTRAAVIGLARDSFLFGLAPSDLTVRALRALRRFEIV